MSNLLIIGNGFDLAHGLETSYKHFIDNIKLGKHKHPEGISLMKGILGVPLNESSGTYSSYFNQEDIDGSDGKSLFLLHLLNKTSVEKWCDIENEYFNFILEDSRKDSRLIKKINMNFEQIKEYLEIYLLEQESKGERINEYSNLFQNLCKPSNREKTLIVNFNYTNTVQRLYSEQIKDAISIHIHGELNNNQNPLIFGYAANENQIYQLLDIEENQYLHNIKRYSYKRTNNENTIKGFLDENKSLCVHILGHSCGVSDRLILETILNHHNISDIEVHYYNCFENYRDTAINIHRISKKKTSYDKILQFPKSSRMPQFDDPVNKKTL